MRGEGRAKCVATRPSQSRRVVSPLTGCTSLAPHPSPLAPAVLAPHPSPLAPLLGAHLACLGLVVVDQVARAWRILVILKALGSPVSFKRAFVINALGEGASSVTPMRLGGEPMRLAEMIRSRIPAGVAVVAIGVEVMMAWPFILLCGAFLVWMYAPRWWDAVSPTLPGVVEDAWPWVAGVAVLSGVAIVVLRRVAPASTGTLSGSLKMALSNARRMPPKLLLASIPCTLLNVASRTAILVVLASAAPAPVSHGAVALGSYTLLYSQLILPTPSGAGTVDIGFLGGASGYVGQGTAQLLLMWRFYTVVLPIALGFLLAAHIYGRAVVRAMIRWRAT
ncbi:MAG TPA: lysylphosphatidylglycerol synthase transmembrane domain-containing protein [Gemmatimonadaceae bacterium]|nr:lysylphosphatidylglycerol synthase transmembrane domain-containing protein [Gemmatimonadaceae bacterium]